MPLLLALALLTSPGDDFVGTVASLPVTGDRPGVLVHDGERAHWVGLTGTAVCWRHEPTVPLPLSALKPGVRVHVVASYWNADRVELLGLGPHEFAFAVEGWVAAHHRPECALSADELQTLAAMGAPCYQIRTATTKALEARGLGALRVLAWCLHSPDAEVLARAEGVLGRLGER